MTTAVAVTEAEARPLVARIVAGVVRVKARGRMWTVRWPDSEQRLEAEEVYASALEEAVREDVQSEEDVKQFLFEEGFWSPKDEAALEGIPKDIENLKVALFESRATERAGQIRSMLGRARSALRDLEARRHQFDHTTQVGMARLAAARFRIARGLYSGQTPVFPPHSDLDDESDLLGEVLAAWQAAQLSESTIRALARSNAWRAIWGCKGTVSSIFGVPACDYTDEQQHLVAASTLYDNVREHPECPPEEVLQDDDLFDGWLILQRRNRERESSEKSIEDSITDPRIKNSQEIFKVVKSKDEAKRVQALNSAGAQATLDKRNRTIERHGQVIDSDLPDVKQRYRMELNQAAAKAMGGGK